MTGQVGTEKDEIEITPEMIGAGLAILEGDIERFGPISPSDGYLVREILDAVLCQSFDLKYVQK